ncbi:Branched-chain_amino acid aminotransferase [Hexamita inflata]|uniref:Branched-chain amino acid aminotransferase n=1 Tax=Hexamita inflata TaxID=28002 RepID=A0AA86NEP3_9EUKA|nr:Branched-chain amino acid aminotransferase [Hexamita inflata]
MERRVIGNENEFRRKRFELIIVLKMMNENNIQYQLSILQYKSWFVRRETQKLYDTVQGIQYGRIADKFNWNWILPQKK